MMTMNNTECAVLQRGATNTLLQHLGIDANK